MAATSAGAVKAFLEAQGLGVSVFRDSPPAGHATTYVTVSEDIAVTPDQSGDFGDPTADLTGAELVQIDLWQPWRDPNGAVVESYTLAPAVLGALHGASLTAAPTRVYGVTVDSMVRLLERDTNTVHHAITVRLRRVL